MTVQLTIQTGNDELGPFNLFSNTDGFITPFETNVSLISLITGHVTINAPEYTTIVRIQSTGICTSYNDVILTTSTP